ncbi:MAG: DUF4365 domain-containing protein [Chryseobacterium sp.]|nr:MAG: DUF4365 domain-containing protein [Chryseobacterium sp.]
MTKEEFESQSLPKSDANANLETISRNKLRAIFSPEDFEIRDEREHDKGIDLFIEVKLNGHNSNLRFPVQLKSSHSSERNKDGSISFSIAVSNINYLLNDGLPAFYIFYHQQEDCFYFEQASKVEKLLREKYPDGTFPQSFTFRFSTRLDLTSIAEIKKEMLSRGYLRRIINKELSFGPDNKELTASLVIQKDQHIYSPSENFLFLERFGFLLLNKGEFSKILEIAGKSYPLEKTSAIFHFVCGTAAQYKGLHYETLNHYKKADMDLTGLHPESQNMMNYYRLQSKRALGMISQEQSAGYLEALMDSEYLGLYLRIQKAFEEYYSSDEDERAKRPRFQSEIKAVLASPRCNEGLRLIAESYELSVEGHRLNDQLLNYLFMVRDAMDNPLINPQSNKPRAAEIEHYNNHYKELKAKAIKDNNQFTYHAICLNGIKIFYIKSFYTNIVLGIDRKTLSTNIKLSDDELEVLRANAAHAGHIAWICEEIGVSDNMIAALSQQYEILHFVDDQQEAETILAKMEKLVSDNEWHGLESKIQALKNSGTSHELFSKMILSSLSSADERRLERERMREEIDELDAEDYGKPRSEYNGHVCINIFPLGNFVLPKENLEPTLDALNVIPAAKAHILKIIKMGAMPILNGFRNPIICEGPDGGFTADKGGQSLTRIYKIRKELRLLKAFKT